MHPNKPSPGIPAGIAVHITNRVGIIQLTRPESYNCLSQHTLREILATCHQLDADGEVGCILIHGSDKAFSAGGDIKEMAGYSAAEAFIEDIFDAGEAFTDVKTPILAAVSGLALGGGCELAMACDIILASDDAEFGQPEINLGIIPGMGGTQRLTHALGKAKAMHLCLTGGRVSAPDAEAAGLVARVVPRDELHRAAHELAELIATKSLPATRAIKEAINAAYEMPLRQGLRHERRLFDLMLATPQRAEGMDAFLSKRPSTRST